MPELRSSKEILENIFSEVAPARATRPVPPAQAKKLENVTASDLMERRFIVMKPQTTLREALQLFIDRGLESAPITQENVLKAILTNQDIISLFEAKSLELSQHSHRAVDYTKEFHILGDKHVGDIARKKASVFADTNIFDAMTIMDENNLESIPVVDAEGHIIGILDDRDILKVILKGLL